MGLRMKRAALVMSGLIVCAAAGAATAPTFAELVPEPIVTQVAMEFVTWAKKSPDSAKEWGLGYAAYDARSAVYHSYSDLGEDYYAPEKAELKARVFDTAKVYLNDPGRLIETYRQFKPVVLKVIAEQDAAKALRPVLRRVMKVMKGQQPGLVGAELEALNAEQAAVYQCYEEKEDYKKCNPARIEHAKKFEAHLKKHSLTNGDIFAHQWLARRHAEGGDALVKTWAGIIVDLYKSL